MNMKYINNKFLGVLAILMLLFSACQDSEDLLDKQETGDMDLAKVYTDIRNADMVLNNLYTRLPQFFYNSNNFNGKLNQSCMADAFSIFGNTTLPFANCTLFNLGQWNASVNYTTTDLERPTAWGDFYRFNYAAIRAAHLFLENIDKVPFDDEYGYGAEERDVKVGEAKFLLAYWNYDLLRNYGGFTIVDRVLTTTSPEVQGKRNTYDECVSYIVNLCDEAAALLPLTVDLSQTGRATRGAAMAVKANTLLFAASPLFNDPAKPDDSPFRGSYDLKKWALAAQAAADIIKLNQYSLVDNIGKIFAVYTNSEVIFQRQDAPTYIWDRVTLPPYMGWTSTNGGRNQMTFSLMKYYKIVKDGKAYDLDDPDGGFDLQNPYVNMDPRFYRDVAYNGANLRQNRTVELWQLGDNTSSGDAARNVAQANTYLYNIKMCNLNINPLKKASGGDSYRNYIMFRYAETLLNYAEAMNEAYGPDVDNLGVGLTAIEAVNLIRNRTRCENYPEYLGNTYSMPLMPQGMQKDEARKEIRQERMVELGFEDNTFYDIRRWKVPVESQRTAEILVPTLSRDTPGGATKLTYSIVNEPRPFETSWYILPIPEGEIIKNPKLLQNPGWAGSPEQ